MKQSFCILFLLILSTGWTTAQTTHNWTGTVNTDWHTAGNWDTNTIPDLGDDVIIDVSLTGVFIDQPVSIRSLKLIKGFVFLTSNFLVDQTNNGEVNEGDGIRIEGVPTVARLTIDQGAILTVDNANDDAISNAGLITNHGIITISNYGFGIFDSGSAGSIFTNHGLVQSPSTEGNTAILYLSGDFTNQRCGIIIVKNRISSLTNHGSITSFSSDIDQSNIKINHLGAVVHNLGTAIFSITTNDGILDTNPNATYWTGCGDEFWSTDMSWSRGIVPQVGDSVIINQNSVRPLFLASQTNDVMHVNNDDVFTIQSLGILIIDGGPATTQTLGLRNTNEVINDGEIYISNTSSNGIQNLWKFTNNGQIQINCATFAAIQDNEPTHPFINNNKITINSANSHGLQPAFGGQIINHGDIDILAATHGVFLWENVSENTRLDNHGVLNISASVNGMIVNAGTTTPDPIFHNHQCAILTIDSKIDFGVESVFFNDGLIHYTGPLADIGPATHYVDNGFQYDPMSFLLDGVDTKVLLAPMSINDFC